MAPPLPNSAHGDQLISAKPRGTARFLSDLICDALETDWLAGAAGFEPLHQEFVSAGFTAVVSASAVTLCAAR